MATDVAGIARPAGRLDPHTALQSYAGPWDARLAAHLLRRAGFGGTSQEVARLASMPMHAAVDSLLNFAPASALPAPPDLYDPRQALRENAMRTLGALMGDSTQRRELAKEIRKNERQSVIALQR